MCRDQQQEACSGTPMALSEETSVSELSAAEAWAETFFRLQSDSAREDALLQLVRMVRERPLLENDNTEKSCNKVKDKEIKDEGVSNLAGDSSGSNKVNKSNVNLRLAAIAEDLRRAFGGDDSEYHVGMLASGSSSGAGGLGGSSRGGKGLRERLPSRVPMVDFLDTRIVPSAICRDILWYLDLRSLARASCVSKYWRRRCCKPSVDWIWQSEFQRLHANSSFIRNLEMHGKTWRGLCLIQEQSRCGWIQGNVRKREYTGHKDRVRHVRIRQDTVVSASWDRTLRMVDLSEERDLGEDQGPAPTKQIASHGGSVFGVWFDGRVAVTCSEDSTIKIWYVHKENEKKELVGHSSPVYRVAMVSSEILISCSKDFVGVWHWPSATLSKKLVGHRHDVHRIQVSDSLIVTGSYDSTVRVWNYPSLDLAWASERVHKAGVSCLHFEGDILATGSARGEVFIWELATGLLLHSFSSEYHNGKTISCIMVSGHRVVSTSNLDHRFNDGLVRVWDASAGTMIAGFQEPFHINSLKTDFGFIFCACSDGVMRIRKLSDSFEIIKEFEHGTSALYDVDVQGPKAVTCGLDGKVVVWSIEGIDTSW